MKKSSVDKPLENFHDDMLFDISLLARIHVAKRIVSAREEKAAIHEAFVFRICADWEILVEELLIDCLNKDTSQFASHTEFSLPKHLSRDVCRAMILGVGYLDFKSVSEIKKLARSVLVTGCNPFQAISSDNARKIDEFYAIRNYLAHYSDASRRKLERVLRKEYGMSRFREPGDFLMSQDRKNRPLLRIAAYVAAFDGAAKEMAKLLGIDLKSWWEG